MSGPVLVVIEHDRGTMLLILSYPLARGQLLAGKVLGHCAALGLATLAGFGSAVALESDRALVGSPGDDEQGLDAGALYLFERGGAG